MSKKVFLCASDAKADVSILDKLDSHLSSLRRSGEIEVFYGNAIKAGSDRKKVIKDFIRQADYLLLLISSDFWSSDFYHDFVLEEALKRAGKARSKVKLIPIFARAFSWEDSSLGKYEALPNRTTPIASVSWKDADIPYKFIVDSLSDLIKGKKFTPYIDETTNSPNTSPSSISIITSNSNNQNVTGNNNIVDNSININSFNGGMPQVVNNKFSNPPNQSNKSNDEQKALDLIAEGNKVYRLQRFEEAINYYEQSKTFNANDGAVYFNIGQCHRRLGDLDAAMNKYKEALAVDPKYCDAYNLIGAGYEAKEDYSNALKNYQKAVKCNPKKSMYHFRVAYLLHYRQERLNEAIPHYEKALQYRPDDASSYFNIGNIFYKQDNYKKAINYFAKTVELDAGHYLGFAYLGYCYYNEGNYREARKQFDISLKIKADQENVIKYRKKADSNIWW